VRTDLCETEERAAREEEREDRGLLDVPKIAIQNTARVQFLSRDEKERLIARERFEDARAAEERDERNTRDRRSCEVTRPLRR